MHLELFVVCGNVTTSTIADTSRSVDRLVSLIEKHHLKLSYGSSGFDYSYLSQTYESERLVCFKQIQNGRVVVRVHLHPGNDKALVLIVGKVVTQLKNSSALVVFGVSGCFVLLLLPAGNVLVINFLLGSGYRTEMRSGESDEKNQESEKKYEDRNQIIHGQPRIGQVSFGGMHEQQFYRMIRR